MTLTIKALGLNALIALPLLACGLLASHFMHSDLAFLVAVVYFGISWFAFIFATVLTDPGY
jgi:hypothetical protein